MIKKTSSNQPCGRDSEYIIGVFLKSFSIIINLLASTVKLGFKQRSLIVFFEVN